MTKDIKVRKKTKQKQSSTNLSLLIESMTEEEFIKFDQEKIQQSIIDELDLKEESAKEITEEVVNRLGKLLEGSTIKVLDTSIIRSFVNVVLYEKGFEKELKSDKDIILSTHDITNIIEDANKENGNMEHSPESINFTIAERIIKEYSLKKVYTKEVEKAHLNNEIYVHDLGASAVRAYCSGHSIEYLKLHGLKNIPSILTTSKPANSAWTLARHLCSFTQVLAGLYAGAIGWEGINVFFAPLLKGWSKIKLKQLAQTLIFDISQLSGAKGGQTAFTDFNCYVTIPDYYKETYAVGKSGKYMGKGKWGKVVYFNSKEELQRAIDIGKVKALKYKHFEKESQDFLYAILDVIGEGDSRGLPFAFPKINLHINENSFTQRVLDKEINYDSVLQDELEGKIYERVPYQRGIELLKYASEKSSKKGCPYFIFDRDGASISACCFTGDTKFFAKDQGYIKRFDEYLEEEEIEVPTHTGNIKKAVVKSYGIQNIQKVYLKRKDGEKKCIKCTPNHEWILKGGKKTSCLKEKDVLFKSPKWYFHESESKYFWIVEKIERSNKKEKVYCLEVEDDESFILDKNIVTGNCRLKQTITDTSVFKNPEDLRFVGVQNVSINLPNTALKANKDWERFYKDLEKRIELGVKAHLQKKRQLEKVMALENSPLKFYNSGLDGKPYVYLDEGSYLIGIVGLNECIYNMIEEQLHDSDEAYLKGLEIISFMNMKVKEFSKITGLNIKLEETPAEGTSYRMATMDLQKYKEKAYIKMEEETPFYTNSIHFAYDSDIDYIDRLIKQSNFHTLVDAGSIIHLWTGEKEIGSEAIFDLIKKTWYETACVQWVLSPEFVCCNNCKNTYIGTWDTCPSCNSDNIMQYTRITGYYVPVNKFNEGKKAERISRRYDTFDIV